jgi:hypothetical protein
MQPGWHVECSTVGSVLARVGSAGRDGGVATMAMTASRLQVGRDREFVRLGLGGGGRDGDAVVTAARWPFRPPLGETTRLWRPTRCSAGQEMMRAWLPCTQF